ncbi:ras-related protein Rap1-like [Hydra vulgaris]|uniref:Ras-related protein Rap1-like n=1 Tax=Hydra vulgaris TaxID=6087 RepID=A0ABM4C7I4_HYDVU
MFKICVIGSGGVGKSCLTIRYLKNDFVEHYDPTMEESYEAQMTFQGRQLHFEILDTAGQEEFAAMLDSSLSLGDAFIILYAVNSSSSWEELKSLKNKVLKGKLNSGTDVPMVIVGNKKDLELDREVTIETAEEYASSIRVPYVETSAKTGHNVTAAFEMIVQEIYRLRPELLERKLKKNQDHHKKGCLIV